MARKKMTKAEDAAKGLKASAKKKGLTGPAAAGFIYGTLNKIGLKKGSKDTKKGAMPRSKKKK
jgi:hypothetical protein